jgi:hypothetical protein
MDFIIKRKEKKGSPKHFKIWVNPMIAMGNYLWPIGRGNLDSLLVLGSSCANLMVV